MPHLHLTQRSTRLWLWSAAIASGGATLVYELVWIRDLSLVIGARYPAVTVVLAAFMLGLGLGSLGGGWLADRLRRPVWGYVGVEVGVALLAGTYPLLAGWVGSVESLPFMGPVSTRAVLVGLALLPATALMGATFPFLSRALHQGDAHAAHVPLLYIANTVGATAGAVLGGLLLPFTLGLSGTEGLAVGLNLLAAGLALVVARRAQPAEPQQQRPPEVGRAALVPMVLAFGSGALVLGSEVFWTRIALQIDRRAYRGLVVEPTDVIALIIVLVLVGSAAGGGVAHWTRRWSAPRVARLLVGVFAGIAVLSLLGLEWVGIVGLGLHEVPPPDWPAAAPLLRLLPLVPAAVLMGISFPLLARVYAGEERGHGARMGLVWTANTAGSVVGSVGAGWFVIPWLGSGPGLVACSGLAVACGGLCVAWAARTEGLRWRGLALVVGSAVAVALTAWLVPLGPGQYYRTRFGEEVVVDAWEGWEATTLVIDMPDKRRDVRLLFTNGREIRWDRGLVNKVRFFRPAADQAESVLLVGFGTGALAREVLGFPELERLVIVEIDGAQFQAGRWFDTESVLADPRTTVVIDDALHYLAITDLRFDAILLDAWGPESSPSLYTAEFHARAREHLSERGVVAAKLNPIDEQSLAAVIDAVRCSYPHAYRLSTFGALLGAETPQPLREEMEELTGDPPCDPLLHDHPVRIGQTELSREDFKDWGSPSGGGVPGKGHKRGKRPRRGQQPPQGQRPPPGQGPPPGEDPHRRGP